MWWLLDMRDRALDSDVCVCICCIPIWDLCFVKIYNILTIGFWVRHSVCVPMCDSSASRWVKLFDFS